MTEPSKMSKTYETTEIWKCDSSDPTFNLSYSSTGMISMTSPSISSLCQESISGWQDFRILQKAATFILFLEMQIQKFMQVTFELMFTASYWTLYLFDGSQT